MDFSTKLFIAEVLFLNGVKAKKLGFLPDYMGNLNILRKFLNKCMGKSIKVIQSLTILKH